MRKREIVFPTILGVIITIAGLVTGTFLLRNPLFSGVGASPEETPRQTKITNISDSQFVVSWVTDKAVSGFVQYGEANPELVVSDDRDQEKGNVGNYFTHLVTVKNLKASTVYKFRIGSGRSLYDSDGKLYEITTGPALSTPPPADVSYGRVLTASGDPAEGSIVYLDMPGIVPQAALVKSSGSWVIPLSTSRTSDLTSFAPYDTQADKIDIFVQAGPAGTAQTIVTTGSDSPVADITLGTVTDLSTVPAEVVTPQPEPTTTRSKFSAIDLAPATEATAAGTLSILTPKFGEEVNTNQPEIEGKGPANAEIQIEIHSTTAITDTVIADKNGNWSYSVPEGLEPGEHTITISTLVNGVVKKVTRSFVVQAAGESNAPAFSATASGTLAPTKAPTLAPTPTIKPTATPTVAPRISYPSTESGVPATGNLTPTLVLAILGIGLIATGIFSFKFRF